MLNLRFLESVASTASGASSEAAGNPLNSSWVSILLLVGMIAVMYFILIRPQKKREKEAKIMRDAISKGDTIVTIGGIHGVVIATYEDSLLIESGSDKSRLRVSRWAVQDIVSLSSTEIPEETKELKDKDDKDEKAE